MYSLPLKAALALVRVSLLNSVEIGAQADFTSAHLRNS
jgi:hypothetical protein